jgi:hypothetical protein
MHEPGPEVYQTHRPRPEVYRTHQPGPEVYQMHQPQREVFTGHANPDRRFTECYAASALACWRIMRMISRSSSA